MREFYKSYGRNSIRFTFFCPTSVLLLIKCLIGFDFIGSAITGPIGKECADLWPRIASAANAIV